MGRPAGWKKALTGRSAMKSPGAPSLRRDVERLFWCEIARGLTSEDAAMAIGASQGAGSRWFRERGGMPSSTRGRIAGEFGADVVGVGVAKVVEDGQGLLPGAAGCGGVVGRVVGVAEAGEGGGFAVAVVEVAEQGEGVLVAGEGLGVVAEVVVGVAEAVPGVGLPVAVAEVLEQGEGLLAGGAGLPVVAEVGVAPANGVERVGLPGLVAAGPMEFEGVAGVVEGLGVVALLLPQVGQVVVGVGLLDLIAGVSGQVEDACRVIV